MIGVNKIIYDVLMSNSELSNLVNNNIYILKIPEKDENGNEINNPVIQFGRIVNPSYNKSTVEDNVTLMMNIYTSTYSEGIEIANKVRTILEYLKGIDEENNIKIKTVYIDSITENYDFDGDCYIQTLRFNIK
jgi:hypothetical protein